MAEEVPGVHRRFTPGERKQLILERVDEVADWIAGLREQAETGNITWKKFDLLVARAMVARERYGAWKRKQALVDTLTGIPNRRWLEFELNREIEKVKRLKEVKRSNKPSLGILMVDIDNLKEINDRYGHPMGDQVLRAVAQTIEIHTRAEDFFARYGGEEFAAIVIEPKEGTLKEIAERLRMAVEEISIVNLPKVTISVGGTFYKTGENSKSFIDRADRALYKSKGEGKNMVTII